MPCAPLLAAIVYPLLSAFFHSIFCRRVARFLPTAPAAVHRDHVAVAHALEVVRRQRRAEAPAAVEDDFLVRVGDLLLDVALDHALAQVRRAGDVARGPLALLAHVDQLETAFPAVEALLHLLDGRLLHAGAGFFDD